MKTILASFILLVSTAQIFGQWATGFLPKPQCQMGSVAYGSKIYLAGGIGPSGHVDAAAILDVPSGTWEYRPLSEARSFPAAVAAGGKVFFAGGLRWAGPTNLATVDILDTLSGQWSTSALSTPRMYAQAAAVGDKVVFAGGFRVTSVGPFALEFADTVDIFDLGTGQWSVAKLSEARAGMAVAVSGSKVFFAGGQSSMKNSSKRVDVFDAQTGLWSLDSLSEPRTFLAGASVGDLVVFAGGTVQDAQQSTTIDIFDTGSGTWSKASLSLGRSFTAMGATVCDTVWFVAGGVSDMNTFMFSNFSNRVDFYSAADQSWHTRALPQGLVNHAVVGAGDRLLVAGGVNTSFQLSATTYGRFCQTTSAQAEASNAQITASIWPNPTGGFAKIKLENAPADLWQVEIRDAGGQLKHRFEVRGDSASDLDLSLLPPGVFTVLAISDDGKTALRRLVKH